MHTHQHAHTAPGPNPVLDIGDDIGAVVVYLDVVPEGGELEARPVDAPQRRFHTGVHLREIGGRLTPVALYPEVSAGDYEILDEELRPIALVAVAGGKVTECQVAMRTGSRSRPSRTIASSRS